MAETKGSRGKDPMPSRRDPVLVNSPNAGPGAANGPMAPAGMRRPVGRSKKGSWFEQNKVLAVGLIGGGAVLVVVLVLCWMAGVFGGSGNSGAPSVAAQTSPPVPPSSTPQAPSPPPEVKKEEPKNEEPKKEEPKKEEKLPLSDDVTKWKGDDYNRARQEKHPKLLEAVVRLGEKFLGNEAAAKHLIDLLKPLPVEKAAEKPAQKPPLPTPTLPPRPHAPTPSQGGPMLAPPPPSMPPNGPGTTPNTPANRSWTPADLTKLVEAVIEALGCNGSDPAHGALEHILAGSLATDDDKAAVEAAIKTLVGHPGGQNDALLLRVLTAPEALRPAARQGPWSAKDMKAKAFELVKPAASAELRTKLAENMVNSHARIDTSDPVGELLLAPSLLNCNAQLAFYKNKDTSLGKEVKIKLEQQLAAYSSMALARCLGVPTENLPGGSGIPTPPSRPTGPPGMHLGSGPGDTRRPNPGPGPGPMPGPMAPPTPSTPISTEELAKSADADLCSEFAKQFWSEQVRDQLEPDLLKLSALEKQPHLVLLAATIPQDSTRAALYKMLHTNKEKHWYEGPKGLEAAGAIDQMLADPALLVILKKLKRTESQSTPRASETSVGKTPPTRSTRSGPAAGSPSGPAQKRAQAEKDWMDVSAKLVSAWCKRLEATATKPKDADAEKGEESDKSAADEARVKLPGGFELNRGAKAVASHSIVLPDGVPSGFSAARPDALRLYYVRAEETSKPKNAIKHYKSQAGITRGDTVRVLDNKKTWIDNLKRDPKTDHCRSIDVLISLPENSAASSDTKGNEEIDLIVEVLIIEVKDPKEPSKN
jgi:hypothetical protein